MPITIQNNKLQIRNAEGNYVSIDAVSDSTVAERIAEINATGATNVGTVNSAGAAQVNAINAKATEVTAQLASSGEMEDMVAQTFNTSTAYTAGTYVIQTVNNVNKLYRFNTDHAAGAWNANEVTEIKLGNEVSDLKSALISSVFPLTGQVCELEFTGASAKNTNIYLEAGKTYTIRNATPTGVSMPTAIMYIYRHIDEYSKNFPSTRGNTVEFTPLTSGILRLYTATIGNTEAVVEVIGEQDTIKADIIENKQKIEAVETELQSEIDEFTLYEKQYTASEWQQGWWGASSGAYDSAHSNAICLKNYISDRKTKRISCDDAFKMRIQAWNSSDTYVGIWNGTTFTTVNPNYFKTSFDLYKLFANYPSYNYKVVLFKQDGSSNVSVNDATDVCLVYSYSEDALDKIVTTKDYISELYDYSSKMNWEVGSIFASGSADYDDIAYAIRTSNLSRIYVEDADAIVSTTKTDAVSLYAFKYNHDTKAFIERIGTSGQRTPLTLPKGYDYRIVIIYPSNYTITSETVQNYSIGSSIYGKKLQALSYADESSYTNYIVNPNFTKQNLMLSRLGSLKGGQSFCKFNDYYYSTDGSKLYVQDASFGSVSETALDLGHGNSLQLGHDGKAYASGWDDQKVYVVDLAEKEIVSTITLPTTGYTTCAVDDVNGLVYIFQRDSRPNTEEYYNFIVYDYIHSQVISTKKTTRAFGAMQSCDFIEGKLFVLYGAGSVSLQNGYMILDTNGNVICEYVLGEFATTEPEGVFVDRNTYELYISFVSTLVYKVSQM